MIRFVLLEVEEQNTVSLAIKNVVPVNSKLQIASARKCTVLVGSGSRRRRHTCSSPDHNSHRSKISGVTNF